MSKSRPRRSPGPWTYTAEDGALLPPPGSPRHIVARFHSGRDDAGSDARPTKADGALLEAAPAYETAWLAVPVEIRERVLSDLPAWVAEALQKAGHG